MRWLAVLTVLVLAGCGGGDSVDIAAFLQSKMPGEDPAVLDCLADWMEAHLDDDELGKWTAISDDATDDEFGALPKADAAADAMYACQDEMGAIPGFESSTEQLN